MRVVNDSRGTITFQLEAQPFPAPETFVSLIVDYDQNLATGDVDGDEFWFELHADLITYGWRWNGADWVESVPPSGRGGYANGTWTVSINRADMNNTSRFDFYSYSVKYSGQLGIGSDESDAVYSYTLSAGAIRPDPTPTPPRVGTLTMHQGYRREFATSATRSSTCASARTCTPP